MKPRNNNYIDLDVEQYFENLSRDMLELEDSESTVAKKLAASIDQYEETEQTKIQERAQRNQSSLQAAQENLSQAKEHAEKEMHSIEQAAEKKLSELSKTFTLGEVAVYQRTLTNFYRDYAKKNADSPKKLAKLFGSAEQKLPARHAKESDADYANRCAHPMIEELQQAKHLPQITQLISEVKSKIADKAAKTTFEKMTKKARGSSVSEQFNEAVKSAEQEVLLNADKLRIEAQSIKDEAVIKSDAQKEEVNEAFQLFKAQIKQYKAFVVQTEKISNLISISKIVAENNQVKEGVEKWPSEVAEKINTASARIDQLKDTVISEIPEIAEKLRNGEVISAKDISDVDAIPSTQAELEAMQEHATTIRLASYLATEGPGIIAAASELDNEIRTSLEEIIKLVSEAKKLRANATQKDHKHEALSDGLGGIGIPARLPDFLMLTNTTLSAGTDPDQIARDLESIKKRGETIKKNMLETRDQARKIVAEFKALEAPKEAPEESTQAQITRAEPVKRAPPQSIEELALHIAQKDLYHSLDAALKKQVSEWQGKHMLGGIKIVDENGKKVTVPTGLGQMILALHPDAAPPKRSLSSLFNKISCPPSWKGKELAPTLITQRLSSCKKIATERLGKNPEESRKAYGTQGENTKILSALHKLDIENRDQLIKARNKLKVQTPKVRPTIV